MNFILTRLGKDGHYHDCQCTLHVDSRGKFNVYFTTPTPEIGLNDNQFHRLTELTGIANSIFVTHDGIFLEDCFVEINKKWHKDGFLFKFSC